jgi:hypothetical protein
MTGLLTAIPFAASAHTPYGQWITYRRKHLLIGCNKRDPVTYDLAKAMAAKFEHLLPDASARVARAPGMDRIASLMGTEQMDVAILDPADAAAMASGEGKFRAYGPVPVGLLALLQDGKVFVARRDFRADHSWLIAAAAAGSGLLAKSGAEGAKPLKWHPGAKAFVQGQEMPRAPK